MAAVYGGRFVAGLGIGQTCVVGPIYLSEVSPAPIRGLCTCMFTGAVYLSVPHLNLNITACNTNV